MVAVNDVAQEMLEPRELDRTRRSGASTLALAALAIGVAESLLGGYVSTSYNDVLLYALLFGIIIFRPEVLGLGAEPA